ncbi:phosphotransferase [Humibacillus xanthopallidus]|uniref:Aminoglycoside phosphotransferase (APT) family kinase protein n=1 Tax=Humibacillus xanthopallidus TaxID=412689 RepID=A0A543HV85_9MICO|nr:phosphotransferase [Humibacillus xanthopallidus]TQM62275.1 aminoglycoside phosphotransferase (APT) family kinase protein [Humibacillus xanthopallidus]
MSRSPLVLAALASSAVPGLDPVSVEGVRVTPGDLFEVAYVQDSQDRRWVVKAPRTAAAGAMLDDIAALSGLLGRRLDVAMPMVRGHAPVAEGRAAVYLRVPGRPLDFSALPPGPLAEAVGRTLAHIHNVELLLFEEAGRPTYDAEAHRRRQLSELDRAAATGHVPTDLLTRWERMLEDVSLWRFAPSPVHGAFTGDNVLASFDDEQDAGSGHVRGVLAWEESRVGDPADDFADLVARAGPDTLDSVLESYARSRVERPDGALVARARLAAEMTPLRTLLRALSSGDLVLVERTAGRLRTLADRLEQDDERHAREDAARSERSRRAGEQAALASALDPDDPEAPPAPEWDATAPHHPFPMLAETQAVAMAGLLGDESDATGRKALRGDAVDDPAVPSGAAFDSVGETPPADSSAVPFVASGDSTATFEIDEVEALPGEDDGLLDLHEGASEFVPVEHQPHAHGPRVADPPATEAAPDSAR